jgi:pyrroline-5-carboxylate reductase
MADALVRGLIAAGTPAGRILVSEPDAARRRTIGRRYKVRVTADNAAAAAEAETLVLAVKPQVMDAVCEALGEHVGARTVVVSIAAGVPTRRLEKRLGGKPRVVRVMPNTPSLVGKGASVLVGGRFASAGDVRKARKLLETVGLARVVDREALLDSVTGLSGSGPAYVYLFAEALIRGGVKNGLDEKLAAELVFQTIAGAAEMMATTGRTPAELRQAVSSPGGTTLAGLGRLAEGDFERTVAEAVRTATRRSRELGKG